jgi:hypothetical protein
MAKYFTSQKQHNGVKYFTFKKQYSNGEVLHLSEITQQWRSTSPLRNKTAMAKYFISQKQLNDGEILHLSETTQKYRTALPFQYRKIEHETAVHNMIQRTNN